MRTPVRQAGAVPRGVVAAGFEKVRIAFEATLSGEPRGGGAFTAVRDGEVLVDLWGGIADRASGVRWQAHTPVQIFSGVKGLVAICVLLLLERGKLQLDEPIARHWPEFAQGGKGDLVVRDIVSHRAGIPGITTPITWQEATDIEYVTTLVATEPLSDDPRAIATYHTLTYGWICGELIRRVDGRRIGRFFDEEVAQPLGLSLWIGLPAAVRDRVARVELAPELAGVAPAAAARAAEDPLYRAAHANPPRYAPGHFPWNEPEWQHAEIPGASAIGTPHSIAWLYSNLEFVLSAETLAFARQPLVQDRLDALLGIPLAFGIGFALQTKQRTFGPPADAFGHPGAGGSVHGCWPSESVAFSYASNVLRPLSTDSRARSVLDALFRAIE